MKNLPNGGVVAVLAIPALTGMAGALSGMAFPLASSAMKRGANTAMYAGKADALDSAGAAAGAILISVAILPASGISGAAAVTALACLLPGIWAIAVRSKNQG
jgi:predicted membrane-bound spermidine synthase